MVGLTPEDFFRMYEHKMDPAVAEQYKKLLDQKTELQDNAARLLREIMEFLTQGPFLHP